MKEHNVVGKIVNTQILKRAPLHMITFKDIDDSPGPYCMSFGFNLELIIRSIRSVGLINNPLLTDNGHGRFTIITGYRRIHALKMLNRDGVVACKVFSESEFSPLECLLLNLHENLATRNLNVVEKGMVLSRLDSYIPRTEILEHYMPLLDLPSHEPTLRFFQNLEEELEDDIKEYLAQGHLSLQTARMLFEIDHNARTHLFHLVAKLKININQQKQLIESIVDISNSNGQTVSAILNEKPFERICSDSRMNNRQKARAVLKLIRAKRFPRLVQSEEAFKKKVSRLGLPDRVKIIPPPFFEAPDYRLEVLFKDGKELKQKIGLLSGADGLVELKNPWE